MSRHGPGPLYVGRSGDDMNPRKNHKPAKPQRRKGRTKGGSKPGRPAHRGGSGGWLFGGGSKKASGKKRGWFW